MEKSVVVIGAGISGLTAAYHLHKAGFKVIVLEAGGRVGGRMGTDVVDGVVIDYGAKYLSSAYATLMPLIEELGLRKDIKEVDHRQGLVLRDGKPRKIDPDSPFSSLLSGLLGPRSWLKFGWYVVQTRRSARRIDAADFYAWWAGLDDETAASWYGRRLGTEIADFVISPMLEGLFFQAADEVSRAIPHIFIAFSGKAGKTLVLTQGIGSLPQALARMVEVRLNTPVQRVESDPDHVRVTSGTEIVTAGWAVLAVPASAAGKIYPQADEFERELMASGYSSTIYIAVAMDPGGPKKNALAGASGLLIPQKEQNDIASIALESAVVPGRVLIGDLVHVYLAKNATNQLIGSPDEEIVKRMMPQVEKYLPGVSQRMRFARVYRWKEAIALMPVGKGGDILQYRQSRSSKHRVWLAGDYTAISSGDGAAESGMWAANQILQRGRP
ncbi:MAG: FAD-dependent oxidoreductase [Elusimicrobia bacterium]|nr:FAD-dependent oxidoreductase [Elusimicrobiota bacterium]